MGGNARHETSLNGLELIEVGLRKSSSYSVVEMDGVKEKLAVDFHWPFKRSDLMCFTSTIVMKIQSNKTTSQLFKSLRCSSQIWTVV